jgi:hypothetical protein
MSHLSNPIFLEKGDKKRLCVIGALLLALSAAGGAVLRNNMARDYWHKGRAERMCMRRTADGNCAWEVREPLRHHLLIEVAPTAPGACVSSGVCRCAACTKWSYCGAHGVHFYAYPNQTVSVRTTNGTCASIVKTRVEPKDVLTEYPCLFIFVFYSAVMGLAAFVRAREGVVID